MDASPTARFHTRFGEFSLAAFRGGTDDVHTAMWTGELATADPVTLRVQSSCITSTALLGDVCDCAEQIGLALSYIARQGRGIYIYLDQEGRGLGLYEKVTGIAQMNAGADTVTAYTDRGFAPDARTYEDAAQIVRALGVHSELLLMTNNPHKLRAFAEEGFSVQRVPLEVNPTARTRAYLSSKKTKLGHLLDLV